MSTMDTETRNELNQRLIQISELKWEGLNVEDLVGAVVKTIQGNADARVLLSSEENTDQIAFAKLVWNEGNKKVRNLLLTKSSNWFMALARDPNLVPVLQATLDKYQAGIRSGDSEGKAAYEEIAAKVAEWRVHVEAAKDDPFYEPQPTPGMIRAVAKFDQRAGPLENHQPNESAVTYPFILGRIIIEMDLNLSLGVAAIKRIMNDVFRFCSIHGQKSVQTFSSKIASAEAIVGPTSNVDLKPMLVTLIGSEDFVTATGADDTNKFVPNHKITLKRIIRLVYICTKYKTVWGLMNAEGEFAVEVKALYELEDSVNSPDMHSLAMIWYLAINRGNICAVMVDHWEKSASNALARLLGKEGQNPLQAPGHVFPLNKNPNENF